MKIWLTRVAGDPSIPNTFLGNCPPTPPLRQHFVLSKTDIEQQTWISEIHNDERKDPHQKNKLRTFRKFKLTHDYENYLTNVRNINHRVAITKLRLSNHKLAIETRRYVKPYQPPDQRICPSVHYVIYRFSHA